jgi:hypothetical protein
VKFSQVRTIIIELGQEEATYLRSVVRKYRDGDEVHSYMTGNAEEDEFVDRFLGYLEVETKDVP